MKSIIRKWHLEGLAVINRGRKAPPEDLEKIFKSPWHIYKSVFPNCTVGCIRIPVSWIMGLFLIFRRLPHNPLSVSYIHGYKKGLYSKENFRKYLDPRLRRYKVSSLLLLLHWHMSWLFLVEHHQLHSIHNTLMDDSNMFHFHSLKIICFSRVQLCKKYEEGL